MSRIALVLTLLTLLALPANPAGAAAAVLDRPSFTCGTGTATMRFSWRPASDASVQYLDVSLSDSGFAPGTFISAGPFDAGVTSHSWAGMRPNVRHYFRVNTLTPTGWQPAADTITAPCRPAEAFTGGRDESFSMYRGVYVLDLGTGAIKRLADTRGQFEFYPNDRTFAWSPDGSRVAVVTGSMASGLHVYGTDGTLRSEVQEGAFNVEWLTGDTVSAHIKRGGYSGESGYAMVNATTGAIDTFMLGAPSGAWSPDGRRLAYYFNGFYRPQDQGLYLRDESGGEDRLLRAGESSQPTWSPDGTRLAVTIREGERSSVVVLDASSGAELTRWGIFSNDLVWSPDGRSLALGNDVVILQADGSSSRTVAKGHHPAWSPDGASLTYIRDGELWLTTLSDGVESPLLRPKLPIVSEQRWSPAGNMIAFRVAGAVGVYVTRPDGTDERYLAPGSDVQWSPKGDRLGFIYSGGDGLAIGGTIYTMTPRGTALNKLATTSSSDAIGPCWLGERYDWSPDGSSIAYWTQDAGHGSDSLFVVRDLQGVRPELIAKGNSPTWSPDGRRIAFTVSAPGGPPAPGRAPLLCEVFTAAADGSGSMVIARNGKSPKWSPDGTLVVVAPAPIGFTQGPLRVVAADGSGQRGEFPGTRAVWSPDGKQLAYLRSSRFGAGIVVPPHTPMQLVISNPDGSAAKVLAEGEFAGFDWSPDGTRIVCSRSAGPDKLAALHVYELATGVSKVLGAGTTPAWSPDGEWIAFTRY